MTIENPVGHMLQPARRTAADRLCEVATGLFYRRGIRAVGVDEIVNETGVTKPTLYRSFASKDDLVATCIRTQMEVVAANWDAIAARLPDDPLGQIRAIVAGFAADIADPAFRGCPATNAAVEFPEQDHPARHASQQCKAAMRDRLYTLARRLDIADPDGLADGLLLLIEGAAGSRHTSATQGPSQALVKSSEMLLAGHMR
ncbi:MAG TPA: helix-turn-helix domain-containing protein [Sphingomonas sp.]|jgi:AcrR family transcriptional regulator|uniref:TetR/AcrR family transcriptional regulator n=1 Tax=Sphingomonas sp. TaxID=28214 RepID=UPI002ED9FB2B